jgi:formate/nitrite transporter FocA (FNT family)
MARANERVDAAREASRSAVPLRKREYEEAERRAAVRAPVVHEAIRLEGIEELARPSSALWWSGLAAGLSMGFSLVVQGALRAALPDEPWRPLIERWGYAVGFLIVVLGRQQLFTENTITPVLPVLTKPTTSMVRGMLRLWAIVLGANLVGALAVAFLLAHGDAFQPAVRAAFGEIGATTIGGAPLTHFVGGIFAGWLLATMVWLLPGAPQSRFAVVAFITYVIGVAGFSHIVAGSVEVFYLAAAGLRAPLDVVVWALPTLAGNIVGGVALVAALMHGQVVAGADDEDDEEPSRR